MGGSSERNGQAGPKVMEAAEMAAHVYKLEGDLSGGWKYDSTLIDNGTLLMRAYRRELLDGSIEYTVANAGTEETADWGENWDQFWAVSEDVRLSISEARKFVRNNPGVNVHFVGHSKGGAEAAANALANKTSNATIFNPAMLNPSAYNLDPSDYGGNIKSYVVEGEALDSLYENLPDEMRAERFSPPQLTYVKKIYLPVQHYNSYLGSDMKFVDSVDMLNNHSMKSVIGGIKEWQKAR